MIHKKILQLAGTVLLVSWLMPGFANPASTGVSGALSYNDWPEVSGAYFGQKPPGMTAEIFAPGIISTDRSEINSVMKAI